MTFTSKLNELIGKNLVGAVTKEDLDWFLPKVVEIEVALDLGDEDDMFGSRGWRRNILGESGEN